MPTPIVRRSRAAALALLALAVSAPAAGAQRPPQPGYQVELSLDFTGSSSMHSVIADGPSGGFQVSQKEATTYSGSAARLVRIAPRTSLRLGVSLADKGITERFSNMAGTFERHVSIVYAGAPITLGYNLVNGRRGLRPFVEAGVVPEVLVHKDDSSFDFDLRRTGASYLATAGVAYTFGDGRTLVLAPELRLAATEYSRHTRGTVDYRPAVVGFKLAAQF